MGIWESHSIRILSVIAFAMAVGCSKTHTQHNGTEDSGGGSAQYSTPDEVRNAIDLAIRMATEPNHRLNVYAQFIVDEGITSSAEFIRKPDHLFPSLGNADAGVDLTEPANAPRFASPFLDALAKNNLERRAKGDCLTTIAGEHKDASVSQLSLNADICVSVGNLTRIPPSSLLREILSLFLHEAAHMAGAQEPEAKIWQKDFSDYFGRRFGDVISDTVTIETFKAIGAAKALVNRASAAALINGKDPKIYGWIGRAAQIMVNMPDLLDPVALSLKMKSNKPELYGNYANSVLSFISEAQVKFELPPLLAVPAYSMTVAFIGASTPEQVQATVDKLSKLLDRINENFLAFTGAEEAQSVCVKPGSLNKGNFNRSVHKPIFPQVSCSP